jgi:hypothetical protein
MDVGIFFKSMFTFEKKAGIQSMARWESTKRNLQYLIFIRKVDGTNILISRPLK